MTVHTYFLFPIFACTFAVPALLPFTVTPVFDFFDRLIFPLPFVTLHATFFLLLLSLIFSFFPSYTFTLFVMLTFFAACDLFGENASPPKNITPANAANATFIFFFLTIINLFSAHFFALQDCFWCAQPQILWNYCPNTKKCSFFLLVSLHSPS